MPNGGLPSGRSETLCRERTDGLGGGELRSRWSRAVIIGALAGLGLASSASAQSRPYVSSAPTISGSAIVGNTLTGAGGTAGGPAGTKTGYAWLRCTDGTEESCKLIDGASDTASYKLISADLGKRMRAARYASRDSPRALVWKMPPPPAAVATPAPTPPKTTPTPSPTPAPAAPA